MRDDRRTPVVTGCMWLSSACCRRNNCPKPAAQPLLASQSFGGAAGVSAGICELI